MTFAWYGQLANKAKHLSLWKIVLISWAIAFFEYCFMVPANNKFGQLEGFNPFQLKTIQEVISLIIFSLFAIYFLGEPVKWNYIVAFIFIIAAVYFMFLPTHR